MNGLNSCTAPVMDDARKKIKNASKILPVIPEFAEKREDSDHRSQSHTEEEGRDIIHC